MMVSAELRQFFRLSLPFSLSSTHTSAVQGAVVVPLSSAFLLLFFCSQGVLLSCLPPCWFELNTRSTLTLQMHTYSHFYNNNNQSIVRIALNSTKDESLMQYQQYNIYQYFKTRAHCPLSPHISSSLLFRSKKFLKIHASPSGVIDSALITPSPRHIPLCTHHFVSLRELLVSLPLLLDFVHPLRTYYCYTLGGVQSNCCTRCSANNKKQKKIGNLIRARRVTYNGRFGGGSRVSSDIDALTRFPRLRDREFFDGDL